MTAYTIYHPDFDMRLVKARTLVGEILTWRDVEGVYEDEVFMATIDPDSPQELSGNLKTAIHMTPHLKLTMVGAIWVRTWLDDLNMSMVFDYSDTVKVVLP